MSIDNEKKYDDGLLDFVEAARYLKISPNTLRQCYKEWGIPSVKVGRHSRFLMTSLWTWIESREGLREDQQ